MDRGQNIAGSEASPPSKRSRPSTPGEVLLYYPGLSTTLNLRSPSPSRPEAWVCLPRLMHTPSTLVLHNAIGMITLAWASPWDRAPAADGHRWPRGH